VLTSWCCVQPLLASPTSCLHRLVAHSTPAAIGGAVGGGSGSAHSTPAAIGGGGGGGGAGAGPGAGA
jgi:hypothetical protein